MELTISIDCERDLIRLLSFLPFKVKPERIQEIALGVCKINDILINGNFDLGLEKGRLTFRMVQSYRDSLIDMEVFKYMIYVSLNTIDEYSEKLYLLSRGKITLDELEDDEEAPAAEAADGDDEEDDGDSEKKPRGAAAPLRPLPPPLRAMLHGPPFAFPIMA